MGFACTSFDQDVARWLRLRPNRLLLLPAAALGIYSLYALGTQSFEWWALARVALFTGIPTLLVFSVADASTTMSARWADWAAVAAIWLPFDAGWLKGIWSWPAGEGAYIINTALAVSLAVTLFVGGRRLQGVNFRLRRGDGDVRTGVLALAGFMAVALPVGLFSGFIAWAPNLSWSRVVGAPLGIFFFIALPEELLFRGLLQNMLEKSTGRPLPALVAAAVIFGATHLNNGPAPDGRYFVMASVAGLFYGWAYRRSRSLLVPAAVHAAVDVAWVLFFNGGR
jgi:membrane protease YdiL (CAAX protease family)